METLTLETTLMGEAEEGTLKWQEKMLQILLEQMQKK